MATHYLFTGIDRTGACRQHCKCAARSYREALEYFEATCSGRMANCIVIETKQVSDKKGQTWVVGLVKGGRRDEDL